jgi:predicted SAM-dependent methyltransferase
MIGSPGVRARAAADLVGRTAADVTRRATFLDRRLITTYLGSTPAPRLHLGCGNNVLEGWLNCDIRPQSPRVVRLDAAKRFPFRTDEFEYIYSEHMIEHVPYESGSAMLAECYRVLRPGGRIRISTPDLAFLMALYTPAPSSLQQRYLQWASTTPRATLRPPQAVLESGAPAEVFVINNFVRDWGHSFIYDERTLRFVLTFLKFTEIERCEIGRSAADALQGLEHEDRLPDGFLRLETLTLEAVKPRA